ncbi:general transcription factor IIF subunit 2-like [Convolutriloba macropyga]|uniref:general transcription factor IIF subunit 2-like n=1 Tax=Convolutriloba macropyga TaxID=536237 RepID=UPI003F51C3AE
MTDSKTNVDISSIGKSLWLIKVPKNLENALMKSSRTASVGTLSVTRQPGKKPTMTFEPSLSVLNGKTAVNNPTGVSVSQAPICVAEKYTIDPVQVDRLTLSVFSETDPASNGANTAMETDSTNGGVTQQKQEPVMGSIRFEGCIKTRGEMKPPKSLSYLKLKAQEFKHQNIPTKLTKLTSEVNNYRPRSHGVHNVVGSNKGQQLKVRDDAEVVKDKIFKAFELHQYYNIQDLQRKTGQPIGYLKDILGEIADYNRNPPHRFTWELKPEYRHYGNTS